MHRVMYSSIAVIPLTEVELQTFLGISRRNNDAVGLTGILLHLTDPDSPEAAFVQVLEGEWEAIERTLDRIRADDLHTDFHLLSSTPVDRRMYPDWSMRLQEVNLSQLRSLLTASDDASADLHLTDLIRSPVAAQLLVMAYL